MNFSARLLTEGTNCRIVSISRRTTRQSYAKSSMDLNTTVPMVKGAHSSIRDHLPQPSPNRLARILQRTDRPEILVSLTKDSPHIQTI